MYVLHVQTYLYCLYFQGKQFSLAKSNCFFDLHMFKEIDLIHFFLQVDLRHMCEVEGSNVVDLGIDLSEFYMSVEWDILEVPAVR